MSGTAVADSDGARASRGSRVRRCPIHNSAWGRLPSDMLHQALEHVMPPHHATGMLQGTPHYTQYCVQSMYDRCRFIAGIDLHIGVYLGISSRSVDLCRYCSTGTGGAWQSVDYGIPFKLPHSLTLAISTAPSVWVSRRFKLGYIEFCFRGPDAWTPHREAETVDEGMRYQVEMYLTRPVHAAGDALGGGV